MSKKKRNYVSVKENIHDWETDGATIEGVYRGCEERVIKGRTARLYEVAQEAGPSILMWGTTVLDRLLHKVHEGQNVIVEYLGENGEEPNRRYKDFDVKVDTEDVSIEGGEIPL